MKKLVTLAVFGVSAIVLSACGGGGNDGPIAETYFITDASGYGVSGIIYQCDSGFSGVTNFEGAFTFDIVGDNCTFDLITNGIVDDLFLEYDNNPFTDAGVNDIYFECVTNGFIESSGYTDFYGYIDDGSLYDGCTLFDIH